jgi:hypothetical protein
MYAALSALRKIKNSAEHLDGTPITELGTAQC